MNYSYGILPKEQVEKYKVKMHKELFWLLLYKDPQHIEEYVHVDFEKFIRSLMYKYDGLNSLLGFPVNMIQILSLLEAARIEAEKDEFNWSMYRKLILDAHAYVDSIDKEDDVDDKH